MIGAVHARWERLADYGRIPVCPTTIPCTSHVRVPVFLVQYGILDHLKLCNLHILSELFLSWFESMPGSHTFGFNNLEDDRHFFVRVLYRRLGSARVWAGGTHWIAETQRVGHGFEG